MSPREYEEQLQALVRAGRYEEAQAVATLHHRALAPRMSPAQLQQVTAMLETAATAVEAAALVQTQRTG